MTRKRTPQPSAAIPEDVQRFVVDVSRMTILENALGDILEETEIDYTIASYPALKAALEKCRQTAREALGGEVNRVDET